MTNEEVAALVGNLAPAKIAHRVDPNDVLAGKASFIPYDGSDPQPGDAVQFATSHGTYQFLVADDGSWQLAGQPKASASNPDVRNFGTSASPDWRQYSQDSKQWEPLSGVGAPAKPAIDAKTQALAQNAIQKIAAGARPTQTELAALNMVRDTSGASAGGSARPFTQTGPGGTGNVAQTPVEAAVDSVTDDPRVRMAMKLGAYMEGGLSGPFTAGDSGGSYGPFQINHNPGPNGQPMHADISRADSEEPAKAAQYMLPEYEAAVDKVPDSLWQSNPKEAARQAAFYAERPATMYDQGRVDAGWNQLFGGTGGPGGGDTGLPLPLASKARTIHTVAPGDTIVDDKGNVLYTAPPKPDKGDPTYLLQQQEQAIQYVQQQIAAGTMTTADANSYLGSIKQQTAAGLAGTTPYDIWKEGQTLEDTRAQLGRDILNNQMQANDTLSSTLLNAYDTGKTGLAGGNYNPLELASETTDFRGGNLGPQNTSGIAQALINAVNPNNPQPTIGQAASTALGLPQPGSGPPLGTPLGAPGTSDQNQQQEAA